MAGGCNGRTTGQAQAIRRVERGHTMSALGLRSVPARQPLSREDLLHELKAGPAGGLRPPSGPASRRAGMSQCLPDEPVPPGRTVARPTMLLIGGVVLLVLIGRLLTHGLPAAPPTSGSRQTAQPAPLPPGTPANRPTAAAAARPRPRHRPLPCAGAGPVDPQSDGGRPRARRHRPLGLGRDRARHAAGHPH